MPGTEEALNAGGHSDAPIGQDEGMTHDLRLQCEKLRSHGGQTRPAAAYAHPTQSRTRERAAARRRAAGRARGPGECLLGLD